MSGENSITVLVPPGEELEFARDTKVTTIVAFFPGAVGLQQNGGKFCYAADQIPPPGTYTLRYPAPAAVPADRAGLNEDQWRELRQLPQAVMTAVTSKEKPAPSIGFSQARSRDADALLSELDLVELNGNEEAPIHVPEGVHQGEPFDFSKFSSENDGSAAFTMHHEQQLRKLGVVFGVGGFGAYDVHRLQHLYAITAGSGQRFSGTVDACIALSGLLNTSIGRRAFVLYEHKQNDEQKRAYRECHPDVAQSPSTSSRPFKFDAHKGQSVVSMLAACAYNDYPVMIDLTDGLVHHLLHIRGDHLFIWNELTPAQAYYKQAELLKSIAMLMSDDGAKRLKLAAIPEELQRPVKKIREMLKPPSPLLEQLDAVVPHLPPSEQLSCSYELIDAWARAESGPMSVSAMRMYGH